jgi:hypothetical protein
VPARGPYVSGWLLWLLLCCGASSSAWGDTDKTIVDLERGQPAAASRYHRPRGAQLYISDKTEVDLATPRPREPGEERGTIPPAATPVPPPPAPQSEPPRESPTPGQ